MNCICGINGFEEREKAQKRKKKKKEAKEHACDAASSTCTKYLTFEKPILSKKERRFVALRRQGSLQSHFYTHMQANIPSIGLEKYYLVTV